MILLLYKLDLITRFILPLAIVLLINNAACRNPFKDQDKNKNYNIEREESKKMETTIFKGRVLSILPTHNRAIRGFPMEFNPKKALEIEVISVVQQSNLLPINPGNTYMLGVRDIQKTIGLDEDNIMNGLYEFRFNIPDDFNIGSNFFIRDLRVRLLNE